MAIESVEVHVRSVFHGWHGLQSEEGLSDPKMHGVRVYRHRFGGTERREVPAPKISPRGDFL